VKTAVHDPESWFNLVELEEMKNPFKVVGMML
jgi:hypothetical protein